MKEITLFATKIGDPGWKEDVITSTTDMERLTAAREWAIANGFDRLREVALFDGSRPDFTATINKEITR